MCRNCADDGGYEKQQQRMCEIVQLWTDMKKQWQRKTLNIYSDWCPPRRDKVDVPEGKSNFSNGMHEKKTAEENIKHTF